MNALSENDRRTIAKRVFDALCAQHPDKYVVLIQPRDAADGLPGPDLPGEKPPAR